jgi:hypothetical protein
MIHITHLDADPDTDPDRIRIPHRIPKLMTKHMKPPALLRKHPALGFFQHEIFILVFIRDIFVLLEPIRIQRCN